MRASAGKILDARQEHQQGTKKMHLAHLQLPICLVYSPERLPTTLEILGVFSAPSKIFEVELSTDVSSPTNDMCARTLLDPLNDCLPSIQSQSRQHCATEGMSQRKKCHAPRQWKANFYIQALVQTPVTDKPQAV